MSHDSKRIVVNNRLLYFKELADQKYWDALWKDQISFSTYTAASKGDLSYFHSAFIKFLPKEGRIIEAGCGLGQYVLALNYLGYHVEGVEWASKTVSRVKNLMPEFPIREGDVTQLDVPNGYYTGYISLGVIEHQYEGFEAFLNEAYRVLEDSGTALISVPFFHPLRQLKARLGFYSDNVNGFDFYQAAFTQEDFASYLKNAGFEILDTMPYDGYKGLIDEIPWLETICKLPKLGWHLRKFFQDSKWIEKHIGHMILYICKKSTSAILPHPKL